MGRTSDARERLMEAAQKLIREHSYGSVTIDAICSRAGVKKGSFYYFFDSKSDLAVTAVDAWWLMRVDILVEKFRPGVPPLERLRSYLNFVSQLQLDSYRSAGQILGCPLFTLGSEISTQDEILRSRICGCIASLIGYFETAIADAQALGEIEGNDAPRKARIFFAFYEGVLTRARIENDPEPIRTLASDALELIGARSVLSAAA